VSRRLLERMHDSPLTDQQREHVTLSIVDGSIQASTHACRAPSALAHPEHRFDVDTPEDLEHLRRLVREHSLTTDSTPEDVIVGQNRAKKLAQNG